MRHRVRKLETERSDGHATQGRNRVIWCYISIMFFYSHHCDVTYICALFLKVWPYWYSGVNLQKYETLKIASIRYEALVVYWYRDFRIYIYIHAQHSFSHSEKKSEYKTIMQLTAVLVFVVLSLVQVAVVKRKLFNFNNNNHVDEWDNVEPETVERGSWLRLESHPDLILLGSASREFAVIDND